MSILGKIIEMVVRQRLRCQMKLLFDGLSETEVGFWKKLMGEGRRGENRINQRKSRQIGLN